MQHPAVRIQALKQNQRGDMFFTFVISADDLLKVGRVERFGESSDGVNRKFDERHALRIADAMLQPGTVMLDAICGDLKGGWEYKDGHLVGKDGAFLSIDDGQHRLAACGLLNTEERVSWSFTVVATIGLDYERRLHIFRQQKLRKPIDARLDLAQRNHLDEWKTDAEREAYKLILVLNSEADSPLKGMIILDETVKRPYEHQHRAAGINANGLWSSLKSVMGKGSPLFSLSIEKRSQVAMNMIRLASETWPRAWRSSDHILSTARGINAVLQMMVSSPEFRGVIGDNFQVESLRKGFAFASRFDWNRKHFRNVGTREIVENLDKCIARARRRDVAGGNVTA